jgi:hypothetical protein
MDAERNAIHDNVYMVVCRKLEENTSAQDEKYFKRFDEYRDKKLLVSVLANNLKSATNRDRRDGRTMNPIAAT